MKSDEIRNLSYDVEKQERRVQSFEAALKDLNNIDKLNLQVRIGSNNNSVNIGQNQSYVTIVKAILEAELVLAKKRLVEISEITFTKLP